MNLLLTLGTATLGFSLAYALGALAVLRMRRAALIRCRLAPIPRSKQRSHLVQVGPRFVEV